MADSQQRFLLDKTNVRGIITRLDTSWRTMLEGRDYPEPVRNLLAQAATAMCLLSATLKADNTLTLQIQHGQPVNLLVMQVDAQQHFRGMAEWQQQPDGDKLSELCAGGQLAITIESNSGERYQSIVDLHHDSLADALHNYFEQSEQLPTDLWLANDAEHAAGMLIQALPVDEEAFDHDPDAWNRALHLASTVTDQELLELSTEDLLHRLYHEEDIRLFDGSPVAFRCSCSRERVANSLLSLGEDELQDLIEERGEISIDCGFCQQRYVFDAVDYKQLFSSTTSPDLPPTTH